MMLDLFEALAGTDLPLGLHNEDQDIVRTRIARLKALGQDGIAVHSASRPPVAELAATAHFLEMGAAAGAHAHIVHLTTPRGFQLVDTYPPRGVPGLPASFASIISGLIRRRTVKRWGPA